MCVIVGGFSCTFVSLSARVFYLCVFVRVCVCSFISLCMGICVSFVYISIFYVFILCVQVHAFNFVVECVFFYTIVCLLGCLRLCMCVSFCV